MKRTEITYRKINKHTVEILDIKNVAFAKDLPTREYFFKYPFYYRWETSLEIYSSNGTNYSFGLGGIDTQTFSKAINVMKQAEDKLTLIYRMQAVKQLMTALHLPLECGPIIYSAEEKKIKHSKIIRRKNKDGSITLII